MNTLHEGQVDQQKNNENNNSQILVNEDPQMRLIEIQSLQEVNAKEQNEFQFFDDGGEKKATDLLNKERFTWVELMECKVEKVKFLWADFIPRYAVTFITGPSDSNKSTLLAQLAIGVAFGDEEFLGRQLIPKHKRAIYVSTEDNGENLAPRIKKQLKGREIIDEDGLIFITKSRGAIDDVKKELKKRKADLVILDAWTDLFKGNMNDASDVRADIGALNELVQKFGCAVVALHHERKGSQDRGLSKENMLGSTGIQSKARSVFQMHATTGLQRRLSLLKSNYGEFTDKPSIFLTLDETNMTLSYSGENGIDGPKRRGRSYSKDLRELITPRLIELRAQNVSWEKILKALIEEFPDEKIPVKNTLIAWFEKDDRSEESANVGSE